MEMVISFPGGARVDARFGPHTVHTDQPAQGGGEDSAATPFATFLASIGTCAGIYVLGFCQARGIPTEGIRLTERVEFDPEKHRLSRVAIDIHLPADFPGKYRDAVRRAAETCAVKRAILDPPEFAIATQIASSAAG